MTHAFVVAAAMLASGVVFAQDSLQKLFEAGKYEEVVQAVAESEERRADPVATYLAGMSHVKLSQIGEAKEAFSRLERSEDDVWRHVGRSASLLASNQDAEALEAATEAAAAGPEHLYANYQLGLALLENGAHAKAAEAFAKAAQIDQRFAYAYYYAGQAYYKAKRVDQMAKYWEYFLKLAPQAPEREAVAGILKTLRG